MLCKVYELSGSNIEIHENMGIGKGHAGGVVLEG
jgi:hypothetical protein